MSVTDQIDAVIRRVASTGQTHAVVLEQTFATTAGDLWDACTDPQRLPRWLEPVEGDLREGGRYRLSGSGTAGTIETCTAPATLRVTWEHEGDASHVELTIASTDDGAVLTLRHTVPDDDHWRTYGPAATGTGWDGALLALSFLLAGDDRAAPERMTELNATDEGRAFIDASTAAWARAHTASGADRADAEAAATRTATSYRGDPTA